MPKVILPTPPPSTYFFSAGFRQVSARLRRVPPGSITFPQVPPGSTGFRRVSPGSAAPPGSARFRWSPGFRQVSSAGFCRVSLPTSLSIYWCQVLDGSCQASVKVAAIKETFLPLPGHCPSRLMEKITDKMAVPVE